MKITMPVKYPCYGFNILPMLFISWYDSKRISFGWMFWIVELTFKTGKSK